MEEKYIIERRHTGWKKFVGYGVTAFLVIAAAVVVVFMFVKSESMSSVVSGIVSALAPVLVGILFAYIMNPLMSFIERYLKPLLLRKMRKPVKAVKLARTLSILATLIIVLLIVSFLVYLLVPELTKTVSTLVEEIPGQVENFQVWFNGLRFQKTTVGNALNSIVSRVTAYFEDFIQNGLVKTATDVLGSLASGVKSIFGILYNILIGIVFSVYLLASKETFAAQSKKLVYAVFKRKRANRILHVTRECHKKFTGAISGKILDSVIVGILCFIGMNILRLPYASLISVVVGVTNIIPFFGPYFGAVPSALLILLVNPLDCLYFVIFIIVLQQIDCNLLDPKIVGGSIGLSAFWVLFACVVFGSLFDILGLLLGVPCFACIYMLVKENVENKLRKKGLETDTAEYMDLESVDEEEIVLKEEK